MKKVGYLVTGLALGLTISVASPVVASTVKTISAKINSSVAIALNGEKVKLNTQPIEYNNLNYLPVGEIGRTLGLGVEYDKSKNTINITSPTTSNNTSQSNSDPVNNPTPPVEAIKTAKVGEPISKDGISATISKVEYMPTGELIDGIQYGKGFKVYATFSNVDSSSAITSLGGKFEFKTDSPINDLKVNSIGNTIIFKIDGNQYKTGDSLSKGKSAEGFVYYQINQDVKIKEISYTPILNDTQQAEPMGKWIIE